LVLVFLGAACGKLDTKGLPEPVVGALGAAVEQCRKEYTAQGLAEPGKLREIVAVQKAGEVYFILAELQQGSLVAVIEPQGSGLVHQVPVSVVGRRTTPASVSIPASLMASRVLQAGGRQWLVAYGWVWDAKVAKVALVTIPELSTAGAGPTGRGFLIVQEVTGPCEVKGIRCFDKDGREIAPQTSPPR
jgi:hypothetical protein